jgi:integrase
VVKPPITPLTDKSLIDFIAAASESKYGDIFLIDLYTGLRQSEILGLTWDCVSFETGIITVKSQLQREKKKGGKYYLTSLKNDKTRYVAAAPTVIELLRKRKEKQEAERAIALDLWQEPIPGLVFENEFGGYLSHTTIRKHFKRVVNKIGIPESRFHDLRHSFAVLCIEGGIDVKTVQESMGHHSASFTLDTYGFVSQKMRTESAIKMQQAIDSLTDKS